MSRMHTGRALAVSALALAAVTILGGCQSGTSSTSPRALAQSAANSWTKDAVKAAGSPLPKTSTKADSAEICRTDHGYFTTTSQWRTITDIAVPRAKQADATAAIRSAFKDNAWTASTSSGLLTLIGPRGQKHKGLITVQTAGESQLVVVAISPCYSG